MLDDGMRVSEEERAPPPPPPHAHTAWQNSSNLMANVG